MAKKFKVTHAGVIPIGIANTVLRKKGEYVILDEMHPGLEIQRNNGWITIEQIDTDIPAGSITRSLKEMVDIAIAAAEAPVSVTTMEAPLAPVSVPPKETFESVTAKSQAYTMENSSTPIEIPADLGVVPGQSTKSEFALATETPSSDQPVASTTNKKRRSKKGE